MVGCGNAPLSSHMHDSGYTNLTNTDYCDVVIKQQRERFPHMQWEVMDALNMDYPDGTFDYVFDKSLIDTLMCYSSDEKEDMGAAEKTQMLFKEMHRVLKPGGRLLQVSLHKEQEVRPPVLHTTPSPPPPPNIPQTGAPLRGFSRLRVRGHVVQDHEPQDLRR